ncbi:hypothetical protein LTR33_004834 [Friedmanniomyces endolithicus]|nr:hypothetical protein LTR33_004834 [Friedmanniomyces endolithicus]
MVAKWVADALGKESVYDLAQAVLGHPFLDAEHAMGLVQKEPALAEELIPPKQTMDEITVQVPSSNKVPRSLLEHKLEQLKERGLMDAGLVLVQNGSMLQGYLAEGELDFGLSELGQLYGADAEVRLLGDAEEGEFDMSHFVDRTPITVCSKAPIDKVELDRLTLANPCIKLPLDQSPRADFAPSDSYFRALTSWTICYPPWQSS